MPWNEEIRATWARMERLTASPGTVALMLPLVAKLDAWAVLPAIRVPTLVLQHTDDQFIPPAQGKYIADRIPGAKYVELPGRNMYHFVEPGWRPSSRGSTRSLPASSQKWPMIGFSPRCLFTDIVDSTRRAAEIGDRDWHAGTVNLSNPRAIFAGSPPRFTRSRVTYEAYVVAERPHDLKFTVPPRGMKSCTSPTPSGMTKRVIRILVSGR